jgi:hypothetical protein
LLLAASAVAASVVIASRRDIPNIPQDPPATALIERRGSMS